ncbi:MAG: hypothetical protein WAW20_10760, partial [Anaerolineae bacterium]
TLVFYHRDHKERREVADLRLICRFFVFSVLFVVECVLHLEFLAWGKMTSGRESGILTVGMVPMRGFYSCAD